jgi:hypothetical protein
MFPVKDFRLPGMTKKRSAKIEKAVRDYQAGIKLPTGGEFGMTANCVGPSLTEAQLTDTLAWIDQLFADSAKA